MSDGHPGRVPPGAALDHLIESWRERADLISGAYFDVTRCADELQALRAALDAPRITTRQKDEEEDTPVACSVPDKVLAQMRDEWHDYANDGFRHSRERRVYRECASSLRGALDGGE